MDAVDCNRIFYQYEMKDAQLLSFHFPDLWYFNSEGLSFMALNQPEHVQRVDLDIYEPYDELFYLPRLNCLILANFSERALELKILIPLPNGEMQQAAEFQLPTSRSIESLQSTPDGLFTFFPAQDGAQASAYLIHLTHNPEWQITTQHLPWAHVDHVPLGLLSDTTLITIETRTPYPSRVRLLNTAGDCKAQFESDVWTRQGDCIYYAATENNRYILGCYQSNGHHSVMPVKGYIKNIAADEARLILQMYTENRECLYQVPLSLESILKPKLMCNATGRKTVYRTSNGFVMVNYDFVTGLSLVPEHHEEFDTNKHEPLGDWDTATVTIEYIQSPHGAQAAIYHPENTPQATILHFHGGPDAHEVEELRLFGALRTLSQYGFRIISLNYRGSIGLTPTAYQSAHRAWDKTIPEDIDWLIDAGHLPSTTPCITVGWSFGATLALRAAQIYDFVPAVIVGGLMADLQTHRQRAYKQDSLYKDWFGTKFGDEQHESSRFFDLKKKFKRPISILSFHGQEDPHCNYDDMQHLRQHAQEHGCMWQHHDLIGGGHYAETLEDSHLIYDKTVSFCLQLAGTIL